MNQTYSLLSSIWKDEMTKYSNRPWAKRLSLGEMDLCHYKGFLLETYHNTAYNPQLQAYATMFIKDNPREIVKKFFLHASSEIAHDLLAMDDLVALGVDEKWILNTRPLPTTTAFQAFTIYNIQFKSVLCYLSYLFHLEMSPIANGEKTIHLLRSLGVPNTALTFLDEHIKADVGHMKLMEEYVNILIKTPEELKIVTDTLKDVIFLHTRMLEDAFENGENIFK